MSAFLRPWPYVTAAALVRVGVLLLVPYAGQGLSIPELEGDARASIAGYVEGLRSRVTLQPFTEDEPAYDEMARNLVAGRGFVLDSQWLITTSGKPAMYAGCIYPLFVAAIYWLFGVGNALPLFIVQIIWSAVAVWFLFDTARRVGGSLAGALAASYYVFHPTLVWCSLAMMSEALALPLLIFVMWLLVRRPPVLARGALVGALLSLLSLTRSTFAYFIVVAAGLLVGERRRWRGYVRWLAPGLACLAAFGIVAAPWTARNYVHFGKLIPFSSKSGPGAWMWNHPGLVVEFGPGAIEAPKPVDVFDPEIQDLPNEAERDARLTQLFLQFVANQPGKFLGLVMVRLGMATLPVAVSSKAHGGSIVATLTAWYAKGVPLVALLASVWLLRARLWLRMLPLALFAVYWLLMQSLAGPGLRYRIPADPVWACIVGVIGGATLAALWPAAVRDPRARRWSRRARGQSQFSLTTRR